MAEIDNGDGTWSYTFTKNVQSGRLTLELQAAIPGGVVLAVNASTNAPYNAAVITSRQLTAAEQTTATGVVTSHDATEPDGSAGLLKKARQAALGLVNKRFADFTTADIKTCLALLCAVENAVAFNAQDQAIFVMPPENPLP